VVEAADGVEALAILEREQVDAIISDILMPNMDGYRLCREVRLNKRLSNLPFIVHSSTYDSPADEKLAMEMGVDKYIKKPAPARELAAALAEVLIRGPRTELVEPAPQQELHLAKLYNETLVNKLEQKNQELSEQAEALRISEEKFRQLADNLNEICWIASADMDEMLYISPAYEKIWGRTCRSLYENPRSFFDGIDKEDRPRVLQGLEGLARGEEYDVEYRVVRPDGKIRWVHDRGSAIRNQSGVIYRVAGITEDITRRKSVEDQLLQAQKMEAVGQLAGGIAHDFNNLLTIIGSSLELLLSSGANLDAQTKDYLRDIANAADRAETLNRQLLAFSRTEAMQVQVLNLNDVVGTFAKLLRRILGEDIRVATNFAAKLPAIKADPGMVEQVLMNLVVNARDAMPSGGQLTISTDPVIIDAASTELDSRRRPGTFVCLSVMDTGCGIAPENISRIFEPFFTTKGVGKGTGLGLATVFGIAEQHHGWIEVSSKLNAGTTFRLFLPSTTEAVVSPDTAARRKIRGGGEKILVVEDDKSVRSVIKETLQRQGYMVVEADSGPHALEVWLTEGRDISLLLTDMVMPGGMTGLELVDALRVHNPELKVVLASGYSLPLLPANAARSKNLVILKKPFSTRKLAETVRDSLDQE